MGKLINKYKNAAKQQKVITLEGNFKSNVNAVIDEITNSKNVDTATI